MSPTSELKKEHEKISELLGIMNTIAGRIRSKQVFFTSDVEDILDFLLNFIEKSHHSKEDYFYLTLSEVNLPIDKEAISVMKYEHVLAHNYLRDINSCVVKCKLGTFFSDQMLVESLIKYSELEMSHIRKERNIVFPIADDSLPDDLKQRIQKEFEQIEESVVHHNFHDHFNDLLFKLKSKYPD